MYSRTAALGFIRRAFAASLLNRAIAPLYNQVFERSPHWLADLLNRLHTQPLFDMVWTVRLMNGRSVRVPVNAGNPRSWEFAHAYHWHDVGIRVLEYVVLSHLYATGKEVVFLDIGANMGVRSLLPLSMGVQSVLFEPNCSLRKFSEDVFQRNGLERYEICNVCLSDYQGTATFYISDNSYGSSLDREWPGLGAGTTEINVNVTTLDHWLSDRPDIARKVALVKIDVEGAELNVLSGARHFIAQRRPVLIVEVCDIADNREKIAKFCEDMTYQIFQIESTDRLTLRPLNYDQFVKTRTANNFFMTHVQQELFELNRALSPK